MQCESKIGVVPGVLHCFRGEKIDEQWELEVQYLLKYKVGVNLHYPKIGEIRSASNAARGSEFEEERKRSSRSEGQ